MPTAEGVVVLLLAGFLLLVAINLQAGWLYAMTALLLAVFIAGVLSARLALRRLSVGRQLPRHAFEGDRIPVTVTARGGGWPHGIVEIDDPGSGYAPVHSVLPLPSRGQSSRAVVDSEAVRRGVHRLRPIDVRSSGLTGLFAAHRRFSSTDEFTVYPHYWSLDSFPLPVPHGTTADAPPRGSRTGLDVDGVREYRDGDSLRHIHWRSTARRGTLVVREFSDETDRHVTVLIDARRTIWADGSAERFEELLRAAASVARFVTETGGSLRIITDQDGALVDITGGWSQSLEALARIHPNGRLAPSEICARAARPEQAVVALSPDVSDLVALASTGGALVAVVSDGVSPPGAAASTLQAMGVPACALRPGEDIKTSLESCG